MRLEGVAALVTGAGQGIGEAVTRALHGSGALVAAIDREPTGIDRLAAELGDRVLPLAADVTDAAAVESAVDDAERTVGPLGVLVNVAGVIRAGSVLGYSGADWAATFAVNTTGLFLVSQAVATRMVPRRRGAIVTVGSNAAGVPRMHMAAYAASKAAASMFTKCLGLELAEYGIRCNTVAPGSTDTAMQRALGLDPAAVIAGDPATFRVGIPLGRIARPSDVADAVLFLASDSARHITMQDLFVDGGATLRA